MTTIEIVSNTIEHGALSVWQSLLIGFIISASVWCYYIFTGKDMILEPVEKWILQTSILPPLLKKLLLCNICLNGQVSLWTCVYLYFFSGTSLVTCLLIFNFAFILNAIYNRYLIDNSSSNNNEV